MAPSINFNTNLLKITPPGCTTGFNFLITIAGLEIGQTYVFDIEVIFGDVFFDLVTPVSFVANNTTAAFFVQGTAQVYRNHSFLVTLYDNGNNTLDQDSLAVDCSTVPPLLTPTPTNTSTPTNSATVTPTNTSSNTHTPTNTPTNTETPTTTPTLTPTTTETPTVTPTDSSLKLITVYNDNNQLNYEEIIYQNTQASDEWELSELQNLISSSSNTFYLRKPGTNLIEVVQDIGGSMVVVDYLIVPTPTITPTKSTTPTLTHTSTPTNTPTYTSTPNATPTNTSTQTSTPTQTPTPSNTVTNTPTNTLTQTITQTISPTQTQTPTQSQTTTITPTVTQTPTNTITNTTTPTKTADVDIYLINNDASQVYVLSNDIVNTFNVKTEYYVENLSCPDTSLLSVSVNKLISGKQYDIGFRTYGTSEDIDLSNSGLTRFVSADTNATFGTFVTINNTAIAGNSYVVRFTVLDIEANIEQNIHYIFRCV